ncbi:MAG: DUF1295 domain-containing protein [Ilumatobacteraceae bacterium]
MASVGEVMSLAGLSIALMMFCLWILSNFLKNASIVDIAWGMGFVSVAWVSFLVGNGNAGRGLLLASLATIWGVRLSVHLAWRNIGNGEDFRYRAMRKHHGRKFWFVSLYLVFALQGVLMWVVSLPLQLGQVDEQPSLGFLSIVGSVVWLVGFLFESIGDLQLAKFKENHQNEGKVMQTGLWKYTRHPNYFGDCVVWWGLAIVGSESTLGRFGFIGAAVMTLLLLKISGMVFLEKTIVRRRPDYVAYQIATSPFIPRIPRHPKSASKL